MSTMEWTGPKRTAYEQKSDDRRGRVRSVAGRGRDTVETLKQSTMQYRNMAPPSQPAAVASPVPASVPTDEDTQRMLILLAMLFDLLSALMFIFDDDPLSLQEDRTPPGMGIPPPLSIPPPFES